MNIRQAAKYLNLSVSYLRNLRQSIYKHEGPKYTLIKGRGGNNAEYNQSDLDLFKLTHRFRKTQL